MNDKITKLIILFTLILTWFYTINLIHEDFNVWLKVKKATTEMQYSIEYFRRHPLEN